MQNTRGCTEHFKSENPEISGRNIFPHDKTKGICYANANNEDWESLTLEIVNLIKALKILL